MDRVPTRWTSTGAFLLRAIAGVVATEIRSCQTSFPCSRASSRMSASTPVFPLMTLLPFGPDSRRNCRTGSWHWHGRYGPDARVFARAAYHSLPVDRVKPKILNTLHKSKCAEKVALSSTKRNESYLHNRSKRGYSKARGVKMPRGCSDQVKTSSTQEYNKSCRKNTTKVVAICYNPFHFPGECPSHEHWPNRRVSIHSPVGRCPAQPSGKRTPMGSLAKHRRLTDRFIDAIFLGMVVISVAGLLYLFSHR